MCNHNDLDPKIQFVSINGHQYCFRQTGKGHPLVIIHGLSETSRVFWRRLFTSALTDEYTILALDLPGFGDSYKPKRGYDSESQAQLISSMLEALKLKEPVLLGHSLGGIIATEFAIRYPNKLSRLIIVDAPIGGGILYNLRHFINYPIKGALLMGLLFVPLIGRALFNVKSINMARQLQKGLRLLCDPSMYTNEVIIESLRNSYEAITQSVWHCIILGNMQKKLSKICVPTLILRGEHDALVSQNLVEDINSRIPNSQLEIIKGACHSPALDEPDRFEQVLQRFLHQP